MPYLGTRHVVTKVPFMNKFFNDADQITLARISNLYEAIPPRCLKGNLICTGSRLAEKIGKDIITPDEYQKIWDAMNQRNNYYSTTNLCALKGLSRGGRSK